MKHHRLVSGGLALAMTGAGLGYFLGKARAAIPTTQALTYSAVVTDAAGTPLTGEKRIQIQIWDQATDGTLQCFAGPNPITLSNAGSLQITLPDSCVAAVHAKADLWVELFVNGDSVGRAKLGAVPYALEADRAATAVSATSAAVAHGAAGDLAARLDALQASGVICPANFARAGNLCVETGALHTAATAHNAIGACKGLGAHLCTFVEMQQACGYVAADAGPFPSGFDPFGGITGGWYGDHGVGVGTSDNIFLTWNVTACNNDSDGVSAPYTDVRPFRCCR